MKSWFAATVVAVGALTGITAQAAPTLIGTQVGVQLLAPDLAIDASTAVTVSASREIVVGDGSAVGANMLGDTATDSFEFIDIDALTITLRLLAGDAINLGTGLGAGSAYIFSGLALPGFTITGASFTVSEGVSNIDAGWLSFTAPGQISFALDSISFRPRTDGVTSFGDVVIQLQTQGSGPGPNPAPEPGSVALTGLALCVLWRVQRRRGQRII